MFKKTTNIRLSEHSQYYEYGTSVFRHAKRGIGVALARILKMSLLCPRMLFKVTPFLESYFQNFPDYD